MLNWLKRKFPKKFKVKLQYAFQGYYNVMYTEYRFFPKWKYVAEWDCYLGWSPKLERQHYVSSFNSMEDIKSFHKAQDEKRMAYNRRRIRWKKQNGFFNEKLLVDKVNQMNNRK